MLRASKATRLQVPTNLAGMSNLISQVSRFARRWPVRVLAFVGAAMMAMLVAVFWLGLVATSSVDEIALNRQLEFARNGLDTLFESIPKDQESVTVWDDAVERTKARDDQWMKENLGEWMFEYYGFDEVFVLNSADRPIHAMREGSTLADPMSAWEREKAYFQPLVTDLRRRMLTVSMKLADSTSVVSELSATDYVMLGKVPSIVSVRPIVPSSGRMTITPGDEYMHIAVRFLGPDVANSIDEQYGLENARFIARIRHLWAQRYRSDPRRGSCSRCLPGMPFDPASKCSGPWVQYSRLSRHGSVWS
jgi:sensor domain CHASE-containing protein